MVSRGEVWWYEPLYHKRRPALVMTRGEAIGRLNKVVVVPATTTIRDIRAEVAAGPRDGMPRRCAFNADHVQTAEKAFLTRRITRLTPAKVEEMCRAIAWAIEC